MSGFFDARFAALEPYTPGLQPQRQKYIKLNTNESPYPPAPGVLKAVARQAEMLNRYPDPAAAQLTAAFAAHFGLEPRNLFLSNGSDEVLAFIFQALCPRGAAFADITYGFYPVYCKLYGAEIRRIPLREDFTLAAQDCMDAGRTLIIANPNAPTGLALSRAELEAVVRGNPGNLVVVDEAYVDFGAESAVPLIDSYDNLMVVGTFSKSRSLAGARLGYAAASAALVEDLNRIKFSFNPYNLNRLTLAAGAAALKDAGYFSACRDKIMAVREKSLAALRELGFICTQSLANFLFIRHPAHSGKTLYEKLWQRDILVRRWDTPRIKEHLRVTVGTGEEMDALLAALREIV